ncbi:hypothetical protein CSKR_200021 [Clonorchis sinensis]|uniref:Uncharacterized protein n=1 Tax=Clonorchis sinensis TaxID=79923 RepID=A0A8T1LX46_CLOSI|nr:hypothetical protein CSKR_200021 [Clonorchis sinensis]
MSGRPYSGQKGSWQSVLPLLLGNPTGSTRLQLAKMSHTLHGPYLPCRPDTRRQGWHHRVWGHHWRFDWDSCGLGGRCCTRNVPQRRRLEG